MPDFYYGFGFSLGYKGLDFTAAFQGVYGNEILNLERRYLCNMEASSNMMKLSLQRFPYGELNRATRKSTGNNGSSTSTFHIEDGSYLRLQNLSLGYTLPSVWTRKARIEKARIYLQGSNLLTRGLLFLPASAHVQCRYQLNPVMPYEKDNVYHRLHRPADGRRLLLGFVL